MFENSKIGNNSLHGELGSRPPEVGQMPGFESKQSLIRTISTTGCGEI
ncbi:hypothetical protein THTE_1949 [Thermogutta terrifontis]|uniref:Uncharacterized protein n=1 Tax=Thermogutta terrifontis TaxID=1331910 RepID=A0A286RF17_9BACT|nr:hypothetical protein THTE_1949 [Thermogutta terrifontis]